MLKLRHPSPLQPTFCSTGNIKYQLLFSLFCFSERTRDREVIVQFKVPNCTNEELKQGREKYERAINAKQILSLVVS